MLYTQILAVSCGIPESRLFQYKNVSELVAVTKGFEGSHSVSKKVQLITSALVVLP